MDRESEPRCDTCRALAFIFFCLLSPWRVLARFSGDCAQTHLFEAFVIIRSVMGRIFLSPPHVVEGM